MYAHYKYLITTGLSRPGQSLEYAFGLPAEGMVSLIGKDDEVNY